MFDLNTEWSISFAGCGFMGIYYVGVISCILERFPRFIQDASKIYGASAGALMAAVVTLGIPLDKCCTDLMHMAKEARKHKLGPLHPAYNLLQLVQESLLEKLPEDAHVQVSGKLCLSLTRVSDGKNLLVSQFDSRDELIQALICSCFVPLYCGVVPPTYRGVYYVDGAVSDNLPRCQLGRTITVSPYAGQSDLCPKASTLTFHEVRFNNVSIHVNSENLYRVTSTFFPPDPEAMAEICQNGFLDALRFLQENDLISSDAPQTGLRSDAAKHACCELMKDLEGERSGQHKPRQRDHMWLDPKLIENLPADLQSVLCKACRETHTAGGLLAHMTEYLPKKVTSYLAFDSTHSIAQRVMGWIPDVPRDISWLFGLDANKQALTERLEYKTSRPRLRRWSSLPSDLHLCGKKEEMNAFLKRPEGPPSCTITRSRTGEATVTSPPAEGRGWALGRVMGLLQNLGSAKKSDPK